MVHNPDCGDTLQDDNFLETGGGDGSSDFPVGFVSYYLLQILCLSRSIQGSGNHKILQIDCLWYQAFGGILPTS